MIAAAFEASSREASLALTVDGTVLEQDLVGAKAHASDMVPCLAELCERAGIHPREIKLLVLGLGPGSFTGLRVAAATVLGLSRGSGAQVVGVPSHEALAWKYLNATPDQPEVVVLQDARGGAIQYSHYRRGTNLPEVLSPPTRIPVEDALSTLPPHVPLLTDSAGLAAAGLDDSNEGRVVGGTRPEAGALLQIGLRHFAQSGGTPLEQLRPLYLAAFTPKVRRR